MVGSVTTLSKVLVVAVTVAHIILSLVDPIDDIMLAILQGSLSAITSTPRARRFLSPQLLSYERTTDSALLSRGGRMKFVVCLR